MAIENDLENPDKSPLFKKYPHILADHHVTVFISDCLRLIVGGNLDPHGLESLLEYDLETHHREAHEPAHAVQKTAGNTRRLTSWVIGEAVRQMAEWRALGLDIDVAVNLSASDILDPQLGSEVLRCLEAHGVAPTKLLLEITESAVMRDPALAARHMQLLRVTGVRFAMDDFGTGYSSLSQLSRLPVDELKIDRSLIAHAHARPDDAMIVTSTIELAHSMGLRVVAEGVENVEAWNLLRRLGCDLAQGYLISKPLPPHEVIAFVGRANQLLQDSDSTLLQMQALEQLAAIGR
jgi:EAL domain-containing protein (putative c-di-GMP-specific phosphodiesterase class I)